MIVLKYSYTCIKIILCITFFNINAKISAKKLVWKIQLQILTMLFIDKCKNKCKKIK